ncbi:MAG: twitch domain-containing radical SAM protein [Elusimicrobia bacterium]|nr:twitch domain-containing radical SAM protein [Elusimicrobiota bacterium]
MTRGTSPPDRDVLLKASTAFCLMPWIHLQVRPDGKVFPCCLAEGSPVGDLHGATLRDIWNSESLRRIRLGMMRSETSPGCAKCYETEAHGGTSYRMGVNLLYAHHFPAVLSTEEDGSVARLALPLLDIRFSNICDFRCRTCNSTASSSWYEEELVLYGRLGHPKILTPTEDFESLWGQVEPLLDTVEEVYFAGGEPLVSAGARRMLDGLVQRGSRQVRLRYNTNLSKGGLRRQDLMEAWNLFDSVTVEASLDGMRERGEYLRKGQRWADVVECRETMARICPRVRFIITPTLSAMNILHFPDFHRDWIEKRYIAPSDIHINLLMDPAEYRIQILPKRLKHEAAEKYRDHIDSLARGHGESAREAIAQLEAALRFLDAEDLSGHLDDFRRRTRALDRLRKEDFCAVFPELRELFA